MEIKQIQRKLLRWDKSLSVGITEIDTQHKVIIATLNNIATALEMNYSYESIKSSMLNFKQYMDRHLQCEENYMFYIGYPGYCQHEDAHKELKDSINSLIINLEKHVAGKVDIYNFIQDWFTNHIQSEDAAIGEYASSVSHICEEATRKILYSIDEDSGM